MEWRGKDSARPNTPIRWKPLAWSAHWLREACIAGKKDVVKKREADYKVIRVKEQRRSSMAQSEMDQNRRQALRGKKRSLPKGRGEGEGRMRKG